MRIDWRSRISHISKALSTLSQKSETVTQKCDCLRKRRDNGDSLTFLRECGQALSESIQIPNVLMLTIEKERYRYRDYSCRKYRPIHCLCMLGTKYLASGDNQWSFDHLHGVWPTRKVEAQCQDTLYKIQ